MKKLKLLSLNLQQTLVYVKGGNDLSVVAVHDKHKSLLLIHLVIDIDPKRKIDKLTTKIKSLLKKNDLEFKDVIYGDAFGCDTWDNKIKNFTK